MNGAYRVSILQRIWKEFPWGTFFFLLAVFAFTTPLDPSWTVEAFSMRIINDPYLGAAMVEKGNIGRQVALLSLGCFATVSLLRGKRNWFRINGTLGWIIIVFLVWAILSITWAQDTRLVLTRVVILVLLSLGALAIAARLSLRDIATLSLLMCGIFLLMSLLTEIVANTFQPFNPSWRFQGLMHAIPQGWNCGLLAIAAFALFKSTKRSRAVYFSTLIVALLCLVLTKSRVAFVSTIVGGIVYFWLVSSKSQKIALVLGLGFFASLICLLLGNQTTTYGEKVLSFGRGEEGLAVIRTMTGRIPLWKECLREIVERPLLGYGYDAFHSPQHLINISKKLGSVPDSPHSGYIATLMGLGLVGALTMVLILILVLKQSTSLLKITSDYAFPVAIFVWLSCNLFFETNLITRPIFPNFLCMTLMAKLGFIKRPSLDVNLQQAVE